MKNIIAAAILGLGIAGAAFFIGSAGNGRYAVSQPATAEGTAYLADTRTGRTWVVVNGKGWLEMMRD